MDVRHETMTPDHYRTYAEGEAKRMLRVSFAVAARQLESGELNDSLAATRIKMMASMLEFGPSPLGAE